MEQHREISRAGRHRRAYEPPTSPARRGPSSSATSRPTCGRAITRATRTSATGYFQVKLARVAVLPGGRRPGHRRGLDREGRRLARRPRRGAAARRATRSSCFEGAGFADGDRVRAVVPWASAIRRWRTTPATHLLHKVLQEVLGDHVRRPAPPCGPTSSASTSRIPQRADAGGARRGRAARQRARLREPAGADLRDAARGGAERSAR